MSRISGMIAQLVQAQDAVTHANEMGREFAEQTAALIKARTELVEEVVAYVEKATKQPAIVYVLEEITHSPYGPESDLIGFWYSRDEAEAHKADLVTFHTERQRYPEFNIHAVELNRGE